MGAKSWITNSAYANLPFSGFGGEVGWVLLLATLSLHFLLNLFSVAATLFKTSEL